MPLQGFLGNRASLVTVRKLMHDFYIQLKNNEANIRFLMLTGVTKDELIIPNNLTDLDRFPRHKNLLCDFLSQKERQIFGERMIVAMRRALGVGDTETLARLSARLRDTSKHTDVGLVVAGLVQYFNKLPFGFSLATEDSARRQFQFFMEMLGAKVAAEEGSARGYADAYKGDKRPVTLVGVNFRTAKRNIDEPLFAAL